MKDGDVSVYKLLGGEGPEYIAYVALNGDFLGVRFSADNSVDASAKARDFFEEKRAEREAAIAGREEGRRKAAETKARRKAEGE